MTCYFCLGICIEYSEYSEPRSKELDTSVESRRVSRQMIVTVRLLED